MDASKQLANAIQERLLFLGLSMSEWKRKSGVSDPTLREMRDGTREKWTPTKERAAETALGWKPRSFDRIREGLPPIEQDPEPTASRTSYSFDDRLRALPAEDQEDAERVVDAVISAIEAKRARG